MPNWSRLESLPYRFRRPEFVLAIGGGCANLAAVEWPPTGKQRRKLVIALGMAAVALPLLSWYWAAQPRPAAKLSTRALIRQAATLGSEEYLDAQYELQQRGVEALPELIAALQTKDSRLNEIYQKTYAALPEPFQNLLPVPVVPMSVRRVAASQLAELGAAAEPAVPALIELAGSTNAGDWIVAAITLGTIGTNAVKSVPQLLTLLQNTNEPLADRLYAAGALARVQPGSPEATALLMTGLNDASPRFRVRAAGQFPKTVEAAQVTLPVLIEAMKLSNTASLMAVIALFEMDKASQKAALPGVIAMLQQQPESHGFVCEFLCELGPEAKEAVPALIEALADTNNPFHWSVVQTLTAIGPEAHAAIPALLRVVKHGEVNRSDVGLALQKIGPPTEAELPAIKEALNDPDEWVRTLAAEAIASMQQPSTPAGKPE